MSGRSLAVAGHGDHVVEATESLGHVLRKVGPAVRGIVSELRTKADFPAEVEVEFTVKVAADSNIIIARAAVRPTSESRCGGQASQPA
jgi:NTP-dependent ternary system trypsin peptidase co-occuring protein